LVLLKREARIRKARVKKNRSKNQEVREIAFRISVTIYFAGLRPALLYFALSGRDVFGSTTVLKA
jgi:hypothetical protein